jgi:thiol-disulfide isomerase/thioredoxin
MSKVMIDIPYLEIQDLNQDGSLKSNVTQGKPTVVMIYASWCPHCTKAMPWFQKFAKDSEAVGVAVQLDSDVTSVGQAGKLLSKISKSPGVPTFAIFSKDGKYLRNHSGDRSYEAIKQALQ